MARVVFGIVAAGAKGRMAFYGMEQGADIPTVDRVLSQNLVQRFHQSVYGNPMSISLGSLFGDVRQRFKIRPVNGVPR